MESSLTIVRVYSCDAMQTPNHAEQYHLGRRLMRRTF